jgi:hypothetical protein
MNYKIHRTQVRTLRQSDPDFQLRDGMVVTPRAGFEILSGCPVEYKKVIQVCINNGWLRPVAHILDRDLMWEKLQNE